MTATPSFRGDPANPTGDPPNDNEPWQPLDMDMPQPEPSPSDADEDADELQEDTEFEALLRRIDELRDPGDTVVIDGFDDLDPSTEPIRTPL